MDEAIRIVHTADVHLDRCFAGAGMPPSFGNRRRQSLRDVFASVARHAAEWNAHAFIIAGDLFESDRVTRDTVSFLRSVFGGMPQIPVIIAPGNHDPYVSASPYATETWPENVHIFQSPEWSSVALHDGALVVHGFAFDGPDVSANPFGTLTVPNDEAVHVAVGHGSERGHQPEGTKQYAPFDIADSLPTGLAYLALGHFHGYTPIDAGGVTRACYSGSPEGHGFNETGARGFLEVEIRDDEPRASFVPAARAVYTSEELDCSECESSHDVIVRLRRIAESGDYRHIARIRLIGAPAFDVGSELDAIYDAVAPEFEFLELRDEVHAVEDFEALARQDTSLGAFVAALNAEIEDAQDEPRAQLLRRARELGVSAFRNRRVPIRGLDRSGA